MPQNLKTTTLNNGIEMPTVGIGVFTFSPEDAEKSVETALRNQYRLVDTANSYVNERATGRGIKRVLTSAPANGASASTLLARTDIFVSSKLWPTEYKNDHAVDDTLSRLSLDYLDLLFLHQPAGDWRAGYRQLESAYKAGKIRSIGISNFEGTYFDELLEFCEIKPQVIQVECHPYFTQEETRRITDPLGIKIMSWYPLGHGDAALINEPLFA